MRGERRSLSSYDSVISALLGLSGGSSLHSSAWRPAVLDACSRRTAGVLASMEYDSAFRGLWPWIASRAIECGEVVLYLDNDLRLREVIDYELEGTASMLRYQSVTLEGPTRSEIYRSVEASQVIHAVLRPCRTMPWRGEKWRECGHVVPQLCAVDIAIELDGRRAPWNGDSCNLERFPGGPHPKGSETPGTGRGPLIPASGRTFGHGRDGAFPSPGETSTQHHDRTTNGAVSTVGRPLREFGRSPRLGGPWPDRGHDTTGRLAFLDRHDSGGVGVHSADGGGKGAGASRYAGYTPRTGRTYPVESTSRHGRKIEGQGMVCGGCRETGGIVGRHKAMGKPIEPGTPNPGESVTDFRNRRYLEVYRQSFQNGQAGAQAELDNLGQVRFLQNLERMREAGRKDGRKNIDSPVPDSIPHNRLL